jgi:uncharacterized membrane protein
MSGDTTAKPIRGPILLALALTCFSGWLFKGHCVADGGWTDAEQYVTGCYSDAVPFWGGRGVAAGEIPYLQARLEYPVLTGALIWLEGLATRLLLGARAGSPGFLLVVTLVNAGLAWWTLRSLQRFGAEGWRLWAWAAAPPIVLYLGHNWDMLAIALAMAALLLTHRGDIVSGAAVAGLGVAAKLFPVLLLPLLGLAALFERGRSAPQRVARASAVTVAAVAVYAVVNLPVALLAFDNWAEFYRFSAERTPTAAATWQVLAEAGLLRLDLPRLNLAASASFVIGAALILLAGWRAHRDRLWMLFTPLLAWFILTNKVHSPQFDLWLYPFLLLSLRRPLPVLLFAAADLLAYFAEFWWFAGLEGATPAATTTHIAVAVALRAAVMLWIIMETTLRPAVGRAETTG